MDWSDCRIRHSADAWARLLLRVLETAHASLVEVDFSCQRLHTVGEMLIVDFDSGHVRDKTTQDFKVEGIPLRLATSKFRFSRLGGLCATRLGVERVDDRRRIEKQVEEWIEQLSQGAHEAVVRLVQG